MEALPPTPSNNMPLISLKGSFQPQQWASNQWLHLTGYVQKHGLALSNMHLAEPLTPHTVSRSTNRKLRHCEFTWVHLDQKIALGHSNAPHQSLLSGKTESVFAERWNETLHLYKYCHYKTTVKVCNLIQRSSLWSPNGLKPFWPKMPCRHWCTVRRNSGDVVPQLTQMHDCKLKIRIHWFN